MLLQYMLIGVCSAVEVFSEFAIRIIERAISTNWFSDQFYTYHSSSKSLRVDDGMPLKKTTFYTKIIQSLTLFR